MSDDEFQKCKNPVCRYPLITEDEQDSGYCESCIDRVIERDRERQEWVYYHSGD